MWILWGGIRNREKEKEEVTVVVMMIDAALN